MCSSTDADVNLVPFTSRFISKICLPCVLPNGQVEARAVPLLSRWSRDSTIKSVLQELRGIMMLKANMKLSQPADGTFY